MARSKVPDLVKQARKSPDFKKLSKDEPLKARLLLVALERFQHINQLWAKRTAEKTQKPDEKIFHEFYRLAKEYSEIATWIGEPSPFSDDEVHKNAEQLVKAGLSFRLATEYTELFKQSPGRPITRRQLAVRALELKPKYSWRELAAKLDYCAEDVDSDSETCKERLRNQVKTLKRFLKKYRIPYDE